MKLAPPRRMFELTFVLLVTLSLPENKRF